MISLKCHFNSVRNLTRNLLRPVIPSTRRITKFVLIHIQTWMAQEDSPFDGLEADRIFPVYVDISEHQDKLFFISGYPFKTNTEKV